MRSLFNLLLKVRESYHYVRISAEARADLLWWIEGLDRFNGTCSFKCDIPAPLFSFATDACDLGGGGYLDGDWFFAAWLSDYPELAESHINEKELFAVVLALRRWGSALHRTHVRIRSDNSATIAALNKSTSRSVSLMPHIREIFWLCVYYDIAVTAVFIPGKFNTVADRISRLMSYADACDARLLLAGFTNALVVCSRNMSLTTFLLLQIIWTRTMRVYALRPLNTKGKHWPNRLSQRIGLS
jgi:hypothetical protein